MSDCEGVEVRDRRCDLIAWQLRDAVRECLPLAPIRFVVTCDFHHEDSACDQWMESLVSPGGED